MAKTHFWTLNLKFLNRIMISILFYDLQDQVEMMDNPETQASYT